MLGFPIKTIKYIKRVLLRQQKEVEKNLKVVDKDDPAKGEGVVESSEPGTDSYIADTHTRIIVLKDQLKKTSGSIKNALVKIRKGTYGRCERCGNRIEIGRLLAMPTTPYCLSCSKKVSR